MKIQTFNKKFDNGDLNFVEKSSSPKLFLYSLLNGMGGSISGLKSFKEGKTCQSLIFIPEGSWYIIHIKINNPG